MMAKRISAIVLALAVMLTTLAGCGDDIKDEANGSITQIKDESGTYLGVIGNASAADGLSILVTKCTYSGADRGLDNTDLPDVGTKK